MQLLIAIMLAIVFYLAQLMLYTKQWNKNLSVQVEYSQKEAYIGEHLELIETIENRKPLPLPVLYVKFSSSKTFLYDDMSNTVLSDHYYRNDIFSISGNQQVVRQQHFTTTERGYFVIRSIDLVASDLFMRRTHAALYKNHAALYVYPKLLTNKDTIKLISSILGETRQTRLYEDPLSFRGIREYTTRDAMHKINWKASAKTNELMVNTHFDTQSAEIVILFNIEAHVTQRSYRLAETCISMAATLLYHFHHAGLSYRMAVNLEDPATNRLPISGLGMGDEHYRNLLRTLCRLDLHREPDDFLTFFEGEDNQFTTKNDNRIYLVLSNYRKPRLLEAYEKKYKEGYSMHFLCPERKEQITPAPYVTYVEVNPDAI